jgi:hypothetical protein
MTDSLSAQSGCVLGEDYDYVTRRLTRALAERDQLVDAIVESLGPLDNLRGYRVAEQGPFLAHVESIQQRLSGALDQERRDA